MILLIIYAVLYPCHRLLYFKVAGWETKWVEMAEVIVRTEFKCAYATTGSDKNGDESGDEDACNELIKIWAKMKVS
jgi:hypothetical protein